MIENNNFPWYLQQAPVFTNLYYGFFPVAEMASPLELGYAFDIDRANGDMLYKLGTYWGMNGGASLYDGLIYNADNWSELKVWTGGVRETQRALFANFIKAKAYAYGRLFCIETIDEVIKIIFGDETYQVTYTEGTMSLTINITASEDVIRSFIDIRAFDLYFIGKPVGIKVNWTYNYIS